MGIKEQLVFDIETQIHKEVEERLNQYDIYGFTQDLYSKVKKLEEENEKLKNAEPGLKDLFILFLPIALGCMVGSFIGTFIYNLL